MNCYTSFRKFWIAIVLVGFAPSAQAQVDIDTRVGNGADSEIANDDPVFGDAFADTPQGGLGSMNTRFLNDFAPRRHRASLMRFDITGVAGDLSGAGLTVHSVNQSRVVNIYALDDSSEVGIEDWDESTITYNTAPGIINQGSDVVAGAVDPTRYTFLSTWRVPGPQSNGFDSSFVSTTLPEPAIDPDPETVYTDPIDIDANFSTNLSNLVAADTNGLLTLLFYPVGDPQSEGNVALRTKEWENIADPNDPTMTIPNPDFVISPTLNLPNATIGGVENADFDSDGDRDGADFLIWQRGFGGPGGLANGDANDSGTVDGADLAIWESQYGVPPLSAVSAVPEPTTTMLLTIALVSGFARRKPGLVD